MEAQKEQDIIITYLGRNGAPGSSQHTYLVNGEKEIFFSKKLQRHHKIGSSYPARQFENRYTTKSSGFEIKPEFKIDKKLIVEAVRHDAINSEYLRAKSEKGKLEKIARETARKIKTVYSRAIASDKIAMLRAFVEELEG